MKQMIAVALVGAAALGVTGACGGDSSGPGGGGGGTVTAKATDPTGDAFGVDSVQWDFTALTITRDTGGIDVLVDLSADVVSPTSGDSNSAFVFVDFDTDQDSTTGISSIVDDNRPGPGSTGMGVDYFLDLADFNPDSTVNVVSAALSVTGTVRPAFSGKRISVRIPRSLLGGDDAFLNAAAIVGTFFEATDIVPENGHLKVGGVGPVAPYRPNTAGAETSRKTPRRRAAKWARGVSLEGFLTPAP